MSPPTTTSILFLPSNVARVLAGLPSVAELLPDPALEGEPSEAFPRSLRKTEREVYRWIANTHYEHLAAVVDQLERAHAAGCRFGDLLTTRAREQFFSRTAELMVADDLLRRGYTVRTIPTSSQASPDLHVTGDGINLAVEVYCPRELIAIDVWKHAMADLMNYVDVPANYSSSIDTRLEPSLPPDERLQLDPWAPAAMLAQTHDEVLAEIRLDVEAALRELQPLSKVYRHPGTPLLTTVEFDDVRPAADVGPVRRGSFSYPGFSGYSPAGVFRTIVERTMKKARKRQAHGVPADARALVVYLMGTEIAEDLVHPAHMKGAEEALADVEPQRYGLDVIAFVVRAVPLGLAAIITVADDATLTIEQVQALFAASI